MFLTVIPLQPLAPIGRRFRLPGEVVVHVAPGGVIADLIAHTAPVCLDLIHPHNDGIALPVLIKRIARIVLRELVTRLQSVALQVIIDRLVLQLILLGFREGGLLLGPNFLGRHFLAEFLNHIVVSQTRYILRRFTGLLHLLFVSDARGPVCLPRFDVFLWKPPLLLEIFDVVQAVLRMIHDPDLI